MKKKNKENIVFFGALSHLGKGNKAYAASANQVQLEIIKNIINEFDDFSFEFFGFNPNRAWPFSNIFIKENKNKSFNYHSYLNIIGLREVHILFKRINYIISKHPKYIFFYNISFIDSFFVFILKLLLRIKVVLFVQDVNQKNVFELLINKIKYRLVSHFELIIPISKKIIEDFKLPSEKCIIFQGGCTEIAFKMQTLCKNKKNKLLPIAVFAGRLEKYNGIDKLINFWDKYITDFELHIYGSGSYESQVIKKAKGNSKIKFFGLVSDKEVFQVQLNSAVNICLRYSIGLNQNYFFPSKIFNLMSAPGTTVINSFNNIPVEMTEYCNMLEKDFSNLKNILNDSLLFDNINYRKRLNYLNSHASWNLLIKEIKTKL